jgi:hypothetical protein
MKFKVRLKEVAMGFITWLAKAANERVLSGAFAFGAVIGWVTATTLLRITTYGVSDIAAVVAAIGGAAISKHFTNGEDKFGSYCIGLGAGFFIYIGFYYYSNIGPNNLPHPLFAASTPTPCPTAKP